MLNEICDGITRLVMGPLNFELVAIPEFIEYFADQKTIAVDRSNITWLCCISSVLYCDI